MLARYICRRRVFVCLCVCDDLQPPKHPNFFRIFVVGERRQVKTTIPSTVDLCRSVDASDAIHYKTQAPLVRFVAAFATNVLV